MILTGRSLLESPELLSFFQHLLSLLEFTSVPTLQKKDPHNLKLLYENHFLK